MEHAIRAVSVEQGTDPRDAVLVAFGGAGGLHASRLARSLGIPKVLVPPFSGVLSALGLLLAAPWADAARTVMLGPGDPALTTETETVVRQARSRYEARFGSKPVATRPTYEMRYIGQSHELTVEGPPDWAALGSGFDGEHQRHFGFIRSGEPIEVVTIRALAEGTPPMAWSQVASIQGRTEPRAADGVWRRAELPVGFVLSGPAVVIEDTSAILVGEGDRMTVLDDGTLEVAFV
jgi:N-methylhydantoinase A